MRVAIICEYNPFHNGHKYQIEEVKKQNPDAAVICFMSGDFCQRGIPAITSKYNRAKAAIDNGADFVVELNQLEVIQAAHVFADTAVSMFEKFKITHICFGSETGDIKEILKHVDTDFKSGNNASLASSIPLKSNDRLGLFYLKSIKDKGLNIEPLVIKRTDDYFDSVTSATGIRKELFSGNDVSKYTPMIIDGTNFINDYYDLIKYKLQQTDANEISKIHLVSEGIENMLKKNITIAKDWDNFIELCVSKKYTKSRIYRTLLFILLNVKEINKQDKWRLLGTSNQLLQKEYKDIIYTGGPNEIEEKVMNLYQQKTKDKDYLKQTLMGKPYIVSK